MTKFRSVMAVFFVLVIIVEVWRLATGPWSVKPHAFIDGVLAAYFLVEIIHREGRRLIPGAVITASASLVGFIAWTLVHL